LYFCTRHPPHVSDANSLYPLLWTGNGMTAHSTLQCQSGLLTGYIRNCSVRECQIQCPSYWGLNPQGHGADPLSFFNYQPCRGSEYGSMVKNVSKKPCGLNWPPRCFVLTRALVRLDYMWMIWWLMALWNEASLYSFCCIVCQTELWCGWSSKPNFK